MLRGRPVLHGALQPADEQQPEAFRACSLLACFEALRKLRSDSGADDPVAIMLLVSRRSGLFMIASAVTGIQTDFLELHVVIMGFENTSVSSTSTLCTSKDSGLHAESLGLGALSIR